MKIIKKLIILYLILMIIGAVGMYAFTQQLVSTLFI